MAETVRWGILSTADIGMAKVTPAIQKASNCEVVAIASRRLDRAESAASVLGIDNAFGSYEALLATDDVDAVYIPLPNDMHAEWTINAAQAGKHVLCEKPLAISSAQAAEMVEACDVAGVKLAEAFMYRYHPSWVEVLRRVRAGEIGELRAVQSWFSYYNDDPANIRNKVENNGGALMDIGCYNVNLSRLLFGSEPAEVQSAVLRHPDMGIDIVTSAILDFEGGGQAAFTCSTQAHNDQRVHISGTKGRIEFEIPFNIPPSAPTRVFVTGGNGPPAHTEVVTFQPADQYTIQAELFAAWILGGPEMPFGIDDAVSNMTVIEAIFAAA